MDERPLLFLDSGIGGIPYAQFFHFRNRNEKLIYVADRENFPYGPRPRENVIELAVSLVKKFAAVYDPKVLIVACNAISVSALQALREKFPDLPVVGTVPAIKLAVKKSLTRRIGVIGTQRTVEDPSIAELAVCYGPDCSIVSEAAPELVEFIEHRWLTADERERLETVKFWTEKFLAKGADTLVLACTHFLFLKEEFNAVAGNDIAIIDSVEGVTKRVESFLDREGRRSPLASGEEIPLMLVTGVAPLEENWGQLCLRFGFGLNSGRKINNEPTQTDSIEKEDDIH